MKLYRLHWQMDKRRMPQLPRALLSLQFFSSGRQLSGTTYFSRRGRPGFEPGGRFGAAVVIMDVTTRSMSRVPQIVSSPMLNFATNTKQLSEWIKGGCSLCSWCQWVDIIIELESTSDHDLGDSAIPLPGGPAPTRKTSMPGWRKKM